MVGKAFFILCLFSVTSLLAIDESEEIPAVQLEESPSIDEGEGLVAAADNLGPGAAGFSDEGDLGPEGDNFLDPRVLRDFIESRGLIKCRQKEGNLIIAGDVRARWKTQGERVNGNKARGTGTGTAINTYISEVNLFLDYTAPKGWVSNKLRFANFDGSDGGTATKTTIDRAFIGYDIYQSKEDNTDFYIEIGRSRLSYLFESRVEFTTFFDGLHLFYTKKFPSVGQFTIHGGPFVIDSFTNHYGWVVETFVTDWIGTGLSFKYSLIDWHRHSPTLDYGNLANSGNTTVANNPRYSFIVSQMLFGYERQISLPGCKTLFAYAAVLMNHDAKRSASTLGRKLNGAWYLGFTLGKLCKACDWSIDINYQSVQAQAVPEFDLAGIGHGNAADTLLSDAILQGLTPGLARGFTNYKGWEVSALYALTDSLSLRAQGARTTPRNKSIGGSFRYVGFNMAVIYAF